MQERGNVVLDVLLLYLLWFVSCGLGFLDFIGWLNAIRGIAILFGADQWTLPAVHRFSLIALAIVLVIFFFWCESYYRKAQKGGLKRLFRAFGWVTGCQLLLALVAYLIPR